MKRAFWGITSFFLLLCTLSLTGQIGNDLFKQEWLQVYDGPAHGLDNAKELVLDAAGNVYVTGFSQGNGTGKDYLTIKYSPSGQVLWMARYDGPANGDDEANGIAIDAAGDIYVTGGSTGTGSGLDYFTIKYDPITGNEKWTQRYNGPGWHYFDDAGQDVAVDSAGDIIITGYSEGFGGPPYRHHDCVTIKYGPDGDQIWENRYGESRNADEGYKIAFDPDGNIYIGGRTVPYNYDYLIIKLDSASGVLQWKNSFDLGSYDYFYGLAVDASGAYLAGGSMTCEVNCPAPYMHDFVTMKFDIITGTLIWIDRYPNPGNGNQRARAITLDSESNVIVTGYPATVKYNSSGQRQWDYSYGTSFLAIDTDPNDNVFLTGVGFTVMADKNGNEISRISHPRIIGNSMVVNSAGNIYVTGSRSDSDFSTVKFSPTIQFIKEIILGLPDSAFKPPAEQRKNALSEKLDVILENILAGNIQDAANQIENDILAKMDGFYGGNPGNDWIIDPAAQQQVYPVVLNFIAYLRTRL